MKESLGRRQYLDNLLNTRTRLSGGYDAVVFKLSPDLSTLLYSSYFGSAAWDGGMGITYSAETDRIAVAGAGFPVTPGAHKTTKPGREDGFVLLIDNSNHQLIASSFLGTDQNDGAMRVVFDCEALI